jgi:catechol 2,3-dioxygenase-like lactoylglutathione lyase family enzyme
MSLIGQLPLAALWFYCKDVEESKRFYRDLVGLRVLDESVSAENDQTGDDGVHFDLGTVRLTLLPKSDETPNGKINANASSTASSEHLVFVVENSLDIVQADLAKRGVKMKSKKIVEDSSGKTLWFTDPDGHVIYLWQPPKRESKNFGDVEKLVEHYESISRAIADLREIDREEGGTTSRKPSTRKDREAAEITVGRARRKN